MITIMNVYNNYHTRKIFFSLIEITVECHVFLWWIRSMIIMYVHDSDHVCVLICPRCVLICPRCVLICPISSCMCMIAIMYVYNNYHTRKIFFFAHQMVMTCVYHRPIACLQHVYRHTTYTVCLSLCAHYTHSIVCVPQAYRMFTTRVSSYYLQRVPIACLQHV